jgi:hypothetical protein
MYGGPPSQGGGGAQLSVIFDSYILCGQKAESPGFRGFVVLFSEESAMVCTVK